PLLVATHSRCLGVDPFDERFSALEGKRAEPIDAVQSWLTQVNTFAAAWPTRSTNPSSKLITCKLFLSRHAVWSCCSVSYLRFRSPALAELPRRKRRT